MKKLFYLLYAIIFHLCRVFPQKKNRVLLLSPHNANFCDSLGAVGAEFQRCGDYELRTISRRDLAFYRKRPLQSLLRIAGYFSVKIYFLATARYIFLNDNFMPLAYLNFRKSTVITQLWHGEGAFKKFSLDEQLPPQIREIATRCCARYTYVVCSSPAVAEINARAYNMPLARVLPLGSARTDCFFHADFSGEANRARLRESLEAQYPACKGKKLVLYAPTFRDNPAADAKILQSFDCARFTAQLGENHQLLVRLHPQIHAAQGVDGACDVTAWSNVSELVLLADVLITDYSSICMDFALLGKPCVFYAYDLAEYTAERGFLLPYEEMVPGVVAQDFDALLAVFALERFETQKLDAFRAFHLGASDGNCAKKIVDAVLNGGGSF